MITATKELSRERKGDLETVLFKKFEAKDINEKRIIDFYDNEMLDNDPEENYFEYGISTNFDGDIVKINVEKFIKGLNSSYWVGIDQEDDEDEKSVFVQDAVAIIKDLNKYIGYDLSFE